MLVANQRIMQQEKCDLLARKLVDRNEDLGNPWQDLSPSCDKMPTIPVPVLVCEWYTRAICFINVITTSAIHQKHSLTDSDDESNLVCHFPRRNKSYFTKTTLIGIRYHIDQSRRPTWSIYYLFYAWNSEIPSMMCSFVGGREEEPFVYKVLPKQLQED